VERLENLERGQKMLMKATAKLLSELSELRKSVDEVREGVNLLLEIEQSKLEE
jgi:predicted nuclease with TOPRIM domain